jgi:hypothetical protein
MIILLAIFIFFFIKSCGNNENTKIKLKKTEQNLLAANDSIKLIKNKNNEYQASIYGYIASEKELKNINKDLYDKVKSEEGKVISLSTIVFKLKQDFDILKKYADSINFIYINPIQLDSNSYKIPFKLKYNYDKDNYDLFAGDTKFKIDKKYKIYNLGTELTTRETQIKLTFGEKIEDDKLRIFVNTNYPGFTPESLQGVLIDPNTNKYIKSLIKKKKLFPNTWSVGVNLGPGYNIATGKYGLNFGVSIQYNLFTW